MATGKQTIYLDHNATTPLHPGVLAMGLSAAEGQGSIRILPVCC